MLIGDWITLLSLIGVFLIILDLVLAFSIISIANSLREIKKVLYEIGLRNKS